MSCGAKNVTGQVIGGEECVFQGVRTVQNVFDNLGLEGNYTATVNGDPADMEDELDDFSFVSFSAAVKGGC